MRALSKPIPPFVVRVTAAILLGVATTVGVAWLLAWYVDGSAAARSRWPRWPGFNYDVASKVVPTPTDHPQQTGVHLTEVKRANRWGTDIVEVWRVWSRNPNNPGYGSPHALVQGTSFEAEMKDRFDLGEAPFAWWRADGWPVPALSAEARWQSYDALGTWPVVGGILIGTTRVLPDDGPRILPLQPIWSGFVIDFCFYALLWYALFSFGNIRSMLRRRRGLCVRCGYKLQPEQARCSECGEAVR